MSNSHIGFIGGGNMAAAIISGLIADGMPAEQILVSEPQEATRDALKQRFSGIGTGDSNALVFSRAAVVVLAIKPQLMVDVCRTLATEAPSAKPLVISIAAGVRSSDIDDWLGGEHAVVRAMPNQPALLGRGVTGIFCNQRTSEEGRRRAGEILGAVGDVLEVKRESDIDAVTAVSGSGPAYVYLFIKLLLDNGVRLGLDVATSRRLAFATISGATQLADRSSESLDELIERVRSPGGTTAAALDSLDADDVHAIFARALTAARERAQTLADEAHEQGKREA